MKVGDICELVIEQVMPGGAGQARLGEKWVSVRGTVPGQRIQARISRKRKGQLDAQLVQVLQPTDGEIQPKCDHFGQPPDGQKRGCGGCSWQQLSYEAQLQLKHQMVAGLLQPLRDVYASLPTLPAVLPSPQVWGYRNKIEFSFSDKTFMPAEQYQQIRQQGSPMPTGFYLGFHAPQAFASVIDIQRCHLISPAAAKLYHAAREVFPRFMRGPYSPFHHQGYWRQLVIREGFNTGQLMVHFGTTSDPDMDWAPLLQAFAACDLEGKELRSVMHTPFDGVAQIMGPTEPVVLQGQAFIEEQLLGLRFRISPQAFFQTNTQAAEVLYRQILNLLDDTGPGAVYDLYSGTGTIAQLMAAHGHGPVYAIEEVASAVADAQANAAYNQLTNCAFWQGKVEKLLPQLMAEVPPKAVILDPPRAGLHPHVVDLLRTQRPASIIYVSCNPVALVRDLHALLAEGLYQVKAWQPVDLFPHTAHVETIVQLMFG